MKALGRGRLRRRRGGVVSTLIGAIIFIIILVAIAKAAVNLLPAPVPVIASQIFQNQNDCSLATVENSGNYTQVNADVRAELGDPSFWALTTGYAKDTALQLPQETFLGFMNKSQEMRDWVRTHAPSWTDVSIYPAILLPIASLQLHATATHDPLQVVNQVLDFKASIAGYSLAALDYVTFGGMTALKTFFDTGSFTAANCALFPKQFEQMWNLALSGNMTRDERAHLLGRAIAITSVMLVLGGSEGFTAKFKAALQDAGLATSWERIKPYLGKIGTTVSTHASYLATALLQKVVQKFPLSQPWEMGFVSDRLDSMVEVLHEKGISNDVIEQKIFGLVQATDGDAYSSPEDIAQAEDSISYDLGGGIQMGVGTQNRMFLYSDQDTMRIIKASWLESKVPGFQAGTESSLRVYYNDGKIVYHHYEGGEYWIATVPNDIAKPGDRLIIHIVILNREDFVKSLPRFTFTNDIGFRWLPETAEVRGFTLNSDTLQISVHQEPPVDGISDFVIEGQKLSDLGFHSSERSFVQFDVKDIFGQSRTVRIYHDGYSSPRLGLYDGSRFQMVSFLSSDDVRLRIVYKTSQAATLYLKDPSPSYAVTDLVQDGLDFQVTGQGVSRVFRIERVTVTGQAEAMLKSGSAYVYGRLGAETAYAISTQRLNLKDVVLQDPALGGPDLYTRDGKVIVEARMLTDTAGGLPKQVAPELQEQLSKLIGRLNYDFRSSDYKSATTGYVVLSYLDQRGLITTIIVEVINSQ